MVFVQKNNEKLGVNDGSLEVNDDSLGVNSGSLRQEYSRSDNTILNKNNMCIHEADALFERLWPLFPVRKGKGKVSDAQKMKLYAVGFDEMSRAVRRYINYVDSVDFLHYQNGGTFFSGGYLDYLDANYEPDKKKSGQQAGRFNDFPQQDYDFEQIERELLSN